MITQKEIDHLQQCSDEMQPHIQIPIMDPEDKKVHDFFLEKYNEFCQKDLSFCLTFVLPVSLESYVIYRVGQLQTPKDHPLFKKKITSMLSAMREFVSWIVAGSPKEKNGRFQ